MHHRHLMIGGPIQYAGEPGISASCQDTVLRYMQYGDQILEVRLLTHQNRHSLLVTLQQEETIAIKSGFASGYSGEGPRTLSFVLAALYGEGVNIEEVEVTKSILNKIDSSSLTETDLADIRKALPVRPSRWPEYLDKEDFERARDGRLCHEFPVILPLALIDNRIVDLARGFWQAPNDRLLEAYIRFESLLRSRTGLTEYGARLISNAFSRDNAPLKWEGLSTGERDARVQIMTGVFKAFRNRRAHQRPEEWEHAQATEFLLVNHVYILESEASPAGPGGQQR